MGFLDSVDQATGTDLGGNNPSSPNSIGADIGGVNNIFTGFYTSQFLGGVGSDLYLGANKPGFVSTDTAVSGSIDASNQQLRGGNATSAGVTSEEQFAVQVGAGAAAGAALAPAAAPTAALSAPEDVAVDYGYDVGFQAEGQGAIDVTNEESLSNAYEVSNTTDAPVTSVDNTAWADNTPYAVSGGSTTAAAAVAAPAAGSAIGNFLGKLASDVLPATLANLLHPQGSNPAAGVPGPNGGVVLNPGATGSKGIVGTTLGGSQNNQMLTYLAIGVVGFLIYKKVK